MSIKERLTKKSGDFTAPAPNPTARQQSTPRTAPGQMLAFRSAMKESSDRVAELEAKLEALEGTIPTQRIDPKKVRASKWANRHETSFADAEYEELKSLIAETGGNTQPIKVRPIIDGSADYEIVFGHRRHRACLDLDLPVLAMVDEALTEQEQFVQMDQENRARKNLSPWEQGVWYKKALTEGLWPSQNAMAKACGLSQGNISSALLVADLPSEVIAAFPSPHEIQFKTARHIAEALKEDRDRVIRHARVAAVDAGRSTASVVQKLLSKEEHRREGKEPGEVVVRQKGDIISIRCHAATLSKERLEKLQKLVSQFLLGTE